VELHAVETGRIRDIVELFAALTWPAPREEMASIGARLGWTIDSETPHSTDFQTSFPTNPSHGGVTIDNGTIGQVNLGLTDRVRDPDAEQSRELSSAAARFRDEVTSLLGDPVRVRGGAESRHTWDLPNGGRVALTASNAVVKLIVLQKRYADIERREESLGIADDDETDLD
jgi:hypothetical protein